MGIRDFVEKEPNATTFIKKKNAWSTSTKKHVKIKRVKEDTEESVGTKTPQVVASGMNAANVFILTETKHN